MASDTDAPVDLYVATDNDPDAARGDWDALKQLADDDVIKVEALVLSSGIVALFEEPSADSVDTALTNADSVKKEKIDMGSADEAKAAASKSAASTTA